MAWKKGQSGNPGGRGTEKAFAEMVRLACYADDRKRLRNIAEKLVALAEQGEAWAVQQVADRLDGKPAQESTVTIEKRDATDWTRDELVAFLNNARNGSAGAAEATGRGPESDSVH